MEIDLLKNYPKTVRNLEKRSQKTDLEKMTAKKFGKDFFDGDRNVGYGGFYYNAKFWDKVIPDFIKHYNLQEECKILDVGCAKGFMLYDFKRYLPRSKIFGIDISEYAIKNSKTEVKEYLKVGNCTNLDFEDAFFDLVISINTIHNLNKEQCAKSLKEITRVTKKNSFITVDAYRDENERDRMLSWNLTAQTIMSVDEWKIFFEINHYNGDYYWFIP